MSRDVKSKLQELGQKQAEFNANLKKKEPKVLKEFKEFINRGSVMDLAVGIIIGSAFTAIVNSLVNDVVMPVVSMIIVLCLIHYLTVRWTAGRFLKQGVIRLIR